TVNGSRNLSWSINQDAIRNSFILTSPAREVFVSFTSNGNANVTTTVRGLGRTGACGALTNNFNFNVLDGAPGNLGIYDNQARLLNGPNMPTALSIENCSNSSNLWLRTNHINEANYQWSVQPSTGFELGSALNQNSISFNRFTNVGTYSLTVKATDKCGAEGTANFTVNVSDRDVDLLVNNAVVSSTEITPTCSQKQYGFTVNTSPFINNSTYTWHLPPGWRRGSINQNLKSSTVNIDGLTERVYEDRNLNNLYIQEDNTITTLPKSGNLVLTLRTGCNQVKQQSLRIQTPPAVTISVEAKNFCTPNTPLKATVSGGMPPYRLTWSTNYRGGNGTFATPTTNLSGTERTSTNTFNVTRPGPFETVVSVVDGNGCSAIDSKASFAQNGGSETVSGWLSGMLSTTSATISSQNLTVSEGANQRVFFLRIENNIPKLNYYQFSSVSNRWELNETRFQGFHPNTTLQYARSGNQEFIFGFNGNNILIACNLSETGFPLVTISPGIQSDGLDRSFKVGFFANNQFALVWRENNQTLRSALLTYNTSTKNFNGSLTSSLAELSGTWSALRYDLELKPNRIRAFYISTNGLLFYKDLDNSGSPSGLGTSVNNSSSSIWNDTQLNFDNAGNVYFVSGGKLHIAQYNPSTNGYGTLTNLNNTVGCNGHFSINKSTGTIYFSGYDQMLYQIYRDGNLFRQIKSSSMAQDFAVGDLEFSNPHLFYRSTNNTVFNLYYLDPSDLACVPRHLREEVISEVLRTEESTVPLVYDTQSKEWQWMKVFDASGKLLKEETFTENSMKELNNGFHILHLSSASGEKKVLKVIK
ncbi:MAG: hypothetical protein SNJ77_12970, partial [Cytophagales bacterium]